MFNRILIANRGEIACRIIRTCKEMGIETVAVYSQADQDSLHVRLADEAVCIGESYAANSYLNSEQILSAAILTECEAIHPGVGFLSENPKFAQMCEECHIHFIGPDAEVILAMGNKSIARQKMIEANVPVIPGSKGVITSIESGKLEAKKLGFPLLIKASAGGGGKGIRRVNSLDEFESQFLTAQQEALNAFGNGDLYMEKIIFPAKHIEFQILADHFGNVIHLGERDCSMQRKNQKVIEETPSVWLTDSLREEMGQAAIRAAKMVRYKNAGTIEFLVDTEKNFYFMEMNTRIQVEHPITEMITGIDLIEQQLLIAAGQPLTFTQSSITFSGHSIECRLNAENPKLNFAPSPGTVDFVHFPLGGLGLRVESFIYNGYCIPPFYDSMLAKLIVHAPNRNIARRKMKRVLDELTIHGVMTNREFLHDLLDSQQFRNGDYTTLYIEELLPQMEVE